MSVHSKSTFKWDCLKMNIVGIKSGSCHKSFVRKPKAGKPFFMKIKFSNWTLEMFVFLILIFFAKTMWSSQFQSVTVQLLFGTHFCDSRILIFWYIQMTILVKLKCQLLRTIQNWKIKICSDCLTYCQFISEKDLLSWIIKLKNTKSPKD